MNEPKTCRQRRRKYSVFWITSTTISTTRRTKRLYSDQTLAACVQTSISEHFIKRSCKQRIKQGLDRIGGFCASKHPSVLVNLENVTLLEAPHVLQLFVEKKKKK